MIRHPRLWPLLLTAVATVTGILTLLVVSLSWVYGGLGTQFLQPSVAEAGTCSSTTALSFNVAPLSGSIGLVAEQDCFTFGGTSGEPVRIMITETAGSWNTYTAVRRPDGTSLCGPSSSSLIECTPDVTGTHTVLVSSLNPGQTGDYNIRIERPPTPTPCVTNCPSLTPTASPTPTPGPPTPTPTASATLTPSATSTATPTASPTPTPPATPVGQTPTPTGTVGSETETPFATSTPTDAPAMQVAWADHNCSGSADPVDSLLTLRFDAGFGTNTGDCPDLGQVVDVQNASPHPWGDVDCGGEVTPVDSLKVLRYDAGLGVTQPTGCPLLGSLVRVTE